MSRLKSTPIILEQYLCYDLESIVRKHTSPQMKVTRARIILLADEGYGIRKTVRRLNISRTQVQRWRQRWLFAACLADVNFVLSDAIRPGAPATYTAEQICALIAMACEQPSDSEHPIPIGEQQEIANEAIKRGIVEKISGRCVGRFLQESDLQPHHVRGWLTPKKDEKFNQKCQDVCETYKQAIEREQ